MDKPPVTVSEMRQTFADEGMPLVNAMGSPMSVKGYARELGQLMSQSISFLREDVEQALGDLEQREGNASARPISGLSYRFSTDELRASAESQRVNAPQRLEDIVRPIVNFSQILHSTKSMSSGDQNLIDFRVTVAEAEEMMVDTFNMWLDAVSEFENTGLIEAGVTGKPLAINDEARTNNQVGRIGSFIHKNFVSDNQSGMNTDVSHERGAKLESAL